MTLEAAVPFVATILLTVAVGDAIRSTLWLRRKYNEIAPKLQPNRRALGRAFVVVATLITSLATWIVILTVRRIMGLDNLDFSPVVTGGLALAVLLVPRYLKNVWTRLGRGAPPKETT